MRPAFSRAPEESEGCKYVQDRVWHDRKEARALFDAGAKLFVCGSGAVGKGVEEVCLKIAAESVADKEGSEPDEERLRKWWDGLRNERFATDVFA